MCRRRSLHCQMGQDNSRKTSQHCLRCSLLSLWLVANFEPQHDFLSNLLQDGNTDISIQISQVFVSRNKTRSKVSKTNFMGKPLLNSSEQSRRGMNCVSGGAVKTKSCAKQATLSVCLVCFVCLLAWLLGCLSGCLSVCLFFCFLFFVFFVVLLLLLLLVVPLFCCC